MVLGRTDFRPGALRRDYFGPPSVHWHDVYYELSPVDNNPGLFSFFAQRQLSLTVDERGVVTEAVDHVVSD